MSRFAVAMAAYGALAALVVLTLTDTRLRLGTLIILAMFAAKTWLHQRAVRRAETRIQPM